MIRNILLATDGSEASRRAGEMAASLATHYDAQVTVIHAFDAVPRFLGEPDYSQAAGRVVSAAQSLVAEMTGYLRDMGAVDVQTEVLEGPATSAILRMAETRNPDLIVMGARGLGTWQGLMLGSVSLAVTQRAQCPVLVVK